MARCRSYQLTMRLTAKTTIFSTEKGAGGPLPTNLTTNQFCDAIVADAGLEYKENLQMAATRYGRIYHSDNHHISLCFSSAKAREDFRGEFDAYHAGHDHDGEVPRFVNITAKDTKGYGNSGRTHGVIHPVKLVVLSNGEFVKDHNEQAEYVTIDGYTLNEIKDYHNPSGVLEYSWYKPPTSCVPPIIVVENKFIDSNILQRHPLSAIFGDMSDDDYQSLIESVQKDGFIDNVVRVYEGQILDGWHRYRAGRELNLLRKLKFQQWNEDEHRDGDPKVFVLARNIERRHLTPGQRAQIVVSFNERFQKGDIDSQRDGTPNGEPKTREDLAKESGVGTSTIDRAVAVEKEGQSEVVIAGKKTAGEVLAEAKQRRVDCKRELTDILKKDFVLDLSDDDRSHLAQKHDLKPADVQKLRDQVYNTEIAKARTRWQKGYTKVRSAWMDNKALSTSVEWEAFTAVAIEQTDISALSAETFTDADNRIKTCGDYKLLQHEGNCLQTLAVHIRNPSIWVSDLIPQEVRDEYEVKELWEKIDARLPKWKERLPVENQDVPVEDFTKDLLITTFREGSAERQQHSNFMNFEIGEPGTPLSLRELDELRCAVQNESYWLIYAVRKALLSETKKLPLQEALPESDEGIDKSEPVDASHQENLETLDAIEAQVKETAAQETPQRSVADVLGEDTLEFVTVCLRKPPVDGESKGNLVYICFDDDGNATDRPTADIPVDLLVRLLEIAIAKKNG